MNDSELKLFATAVGNRLQFRDSVVKATNLNVSTSIDGFEIRGAAAYFGADIEMLPELRGGNITGQSLKVYDGEQEIVFTLATGPGQVASGIPVIVSPTARLAEIARAIKSQIDASSLNVSTSIDGAVLQIRGLSNQADEKYSLAFATPVSSTGNPSDAAFKRTNFQLDVALTDNVTNGPDGAVVTIFDGEQELTFEFDNLPPAAGIPAVLPGNLAVPVGANPTSRDLIAALIERIESTDLKVQVVGTTRNFKISGTDNPIGVSSATDSVVVTGLGDIGTSPGFGIGIPADGLELSDAVDEGQSFIISRGPFTEIFEIDFDGIQEIDGSTLVTIPGTLCSIVLQIRLFKRSTLHNSD